MNWFLWKKKKQPARTVTFPLGGMGCDKCKQRVEQTLQSAVGVVSACANVGKGTVDITFEPAKYDFEAWQRMLDECGYALQRPE